MKKALGKTDNALKNFEVYTKLALVYQNHYAYLNTCGAFAKKSANCVNVSFPPKYGVRGTALHRIFIKRELYVSIFLKIMISQLSNLFFPCFSSFGIEHKNWKQGFHRHLLIIK